MTAPVQPIPPNEQTEDQPGQAQHRKADQQTKGAKVPANRDDKRQQADRSDRRPDRGARPDEDTIEADDADLIARGDDQRARRDVEHDRAQKGGRVGVEPIGDVINSTPNGSTTDTGIEGSRGRETDEDVV